MKNNILRVGWLCAAMLFVFACAKREPVVSSRMRSADLRPSTRGIYMPLDVKSFKALAYIVADKNGIKWDGNAAVLVKRPSMLRIDIMERVGDVVATLAVKDGKGAFIAISHNQRFELKKGEIYLPTVGKIPISADELIDILSGRPKVEGKAKVSEPFSSQKGSYFVQGELSDLEMSSSEGMPVAFARFADKEKKKLVFEAMFDGFKKVGGTKFPEHVVVRFERPRLVMEFTYKDIQPDAVVPDQLFVK